MSVGVVDAAGNPGNPSNNNVGVNEDGYPVKKVNVGCVNGADGVVVARHECAKLGKGARYLLEARVQEMRGGAPNHMFDGGAA